MAAKQAMKENLQCSSKYGQALLLLDPFFEELNLPALSDPSDRKGIFIL